MDRISDKDLKLLILSYAIGATDTAEISSLLSKEDIERCIIMLLDDFEFFCTFALGVLEGRIYDFVPAQKLIMKTIIDVLAGKYGIRRLIVNVPPGIGKTSITIWSLLPWIYAINDSAKVLHVSRSSDLVINNSSKVRQVIQSEQYRFFFCTEISMSTSAKALWETKAGGAFRATSAFGSATGFRASYISENESTSGMLAIDDPTKPQDVLSPPILVKANESWDNTLSSRRATSDTPVIIIMQRIGEDDFTNHILNNAKVEEDWLHLVIPVYIGYKDKDGNESEYNESGIEIKYDLPDGSIFPLKFTNKQAHSLMSDVQYSQKPNSNDGEVFQKDWLKVVDTLPNIKEWHIKADTATKTNRYSDYTTFSLFAKGTDNKAYHVMLLREKIAVPHLYARFISFVKDSIRTIDNTRFNATLQEKEFKVESTKSNTCILKVAIEDRDSGQGLIQTIKDKAYLDDDLKDVLFIGVKRSEGKYSRALRASDKIKDGSYAIWKELIFKTSSDEQTKLNASNISYIGVITNEFTRFKADDSHKNDDIIDNVFDMMNYEIPNVKIGGFANSM